MFPGVSHNQGENGGGGNRTRELFRDEPKQLADSHRWRRARVTDPEYGRVCACGNLKDQQALRCRVCYADARRDDDARACTCGSHKSRQSNQCRPCANAALIGNQHAAGRPQPQSHPWRKRIAA